MTADTGARSAAQKAQRFRQSILVVLGIGLLAVVVMASVSVWLVLRAQDYGRWIDHTYVVETHVSHLATLTERAETARRGYLLAPKGVYRDTYETVSAQIPPQLSVIAAETADDPIQRRNVALLRAAVAERTVLAQQMMALAASGQFDAAVEVFKDKRDQPLLVQVRTLLLDMLAEESRLLKLRTARERDNASVLAAVVVVGGALLALLSLGSMLLMRRYAADLTEAEGELRLLNVELEGRVKARTTELSRANDEIQRFAYIVSHDLRSPLVNVMGFTSELEVALKPLRGLIEGLKADGSPRFSKDLAEAVEIEMPEAIGFIRSSTRKMDGLINAILRLSREGRRTLTPEPLAMDTLAQGLIDNVRHRLTERGAQAEIEGPLPDLVSDRLAVEQVFGNLVDNAVKYLSSARSGLIQVRGWHEAGLVVYEVSDNGRGVAPQDQERIFELFRRAGAQDQAGEGIGLAHVRALMYRLGGTITCVSALGEGAVFRLSFPPRLSTEIS